MKKIPLTRGQFATVDDIDFDVLSQKKWFAHMNNSTKRFVPYRHNKGTPKMIPIYRDIMGIREGLEIDHVNRDTLDNQRDNLRFATKTENSRNRKRKDTVLRGVFKNGSGYTARITIANGVRKTLGTFKDSIDAARAYDKAAKTYFGDFAIYNNV
jgi:hypothetical protein